MHVVTDDERRRVAAALREYASFDCEDEGEEECLVDCTDWGERVLNLLGCGDTEGECYAALADLIEPSESGQNRDRNQDTVSKESPAVQKAPECDRDALMALADEMEQAGKDYRYQMVENACCDNLINDAPDDFIGYARRIREACGEAVG